MHEITLHPSALAEKVLDDLAAVGLAHQDAAADPDKAWARASTARQATQTVDAWKTLTGVTTDAEAVELAREFAHRNLSAHVTPF